MSNRIPPELQPAIGAMTNWQRNQWAKAGYPIQRSAVERFARLQRDGTELWRGVVVEPTKGAV